MYKISETSIAVNYGTKLNELGFNWDSNDTEIIYEVLLKSMSDFLAQVKSKNVKTALVIKDLRGNFLLAGIVSYHENEDPEMPGNWSYELTFNSEDVNESEMNIHLATEPGFYQTTAMTGLSMHNIQFDNQQVMCTLLIEVVNELRKWLDINAKENEEVEIEQPGYFKAAVVVEKGEKITSITPSGEMKNLIKDDSALEK